MHTIKMVDLQAQQKLIRKQLDVAIAEVLGSCDYILGKKVLELEQQLTTFCGSRFAISCANGTDALTLVLKAKNITSQDAVFVPAFTFTATAEAVVLAGGNPIFVDVLPDSFNMDPRSLEEAVLLAEKYHLQPAAVIPVDLFGLPANYAQIANIAAKHNLWILCDAAQSFGAMHENKHVGTFGLATATSFFPSKPLACYGDGGCIFTDDPALTEILKSIRVHGAKIVNGTLDKYNNVRVGVNSRLDSIQAAILLEKLKIFPKELMLRNKVAATYNELLKEVNSLSLPSIDPLTVSAWAQYTIKLNNTERMNNRALQLALEKVGIPTAIYYSKPISSHPPYADCHKTSLSVSEQLSDQVLSLPMHPYLSFNNLEYIANSLKNILFTAIPEKVAL